MIKKRLSSEDRKKQIISAAISLFAGQGFNKTTLDEIANRVGISRPRIVQLFGSKQGIYEEIANLAYKSHPIDEDLLTPIRKKDDFAVFKAFAAHILHHTSKRKDREIFKILMYARLKEDRFHRIHFHKKDTLMINRLSDYVRQRIKEGAIKRIDYRTLIFSYQAMISNLAIYKNVLKEMEYIDIDELSGDCARIFLSGIAKPEIKRKSKSPPGKKS